jgi:4'-phosphopantetheinyl transferase
MEIIGIGPAFSIRPVEVHVWLFDLDQLCQANPAWEQLLSAEEATRSKRYIFDADRLRFVARRGILRQLLGRYTGMDPAGISYRTNPYGKLSLSSHPLSFNLSNSQSRIAFAFTLEKRVGVDIEQVRPLPDLTRLVECWFSPEEQGGLSSLAPALQVEAFFHIWTQKEAFIKAHGKGLSLPLKDFSVSTDPNQPGRLLSINGGSDGHALWKMASTIPEAGWRVAVCVRAEADTEILWYMPELADFVSCVTSRNTSISV